VYRLLIADDEALEREGLEFIVQKYLPGQFEIIQAENGREAIEKAEEYKPDLVLMDIKMPGIQGLDALKSIREINPKAKMVLITAYDYFSYAKEAVSLGVKDYILKPAKRDQVVTLLHKLTAELVEEKEKTRESLKMQEKLSELIPLAESELAIMLMADQVQELNLARLAELTQFQIEECFCLVLSIPLDLLSTGKREIYEAAKNFMKLKLSCIAGPMIGNQIAFFAAANHNKQGYSQRMDSIDLARELKGFMEKRFGLSVSIGIGSTQNKPEGLRHSYHEAVLALAEKNINANVRHYEDILLNPQLQMIDEATQLEQGNKTMDVIERARKFINENYREDISMEQTAEHVNLSPYYFSKIFKIESGKTFTDYVTDIRIEKAKELIAETNLSLKEVCYEVGYKDPNYFSRVFKRVTGATPTDYRQQLSIF